MYEHLPAPFPCGREEGEILSEAARDVNFVFSHDGHGLSIVPIGCGSHILPQVMQGAPPGGGGAVGSSVGGVASVKRYAILAPILAVLTYAWASIFIRWASEAPPFTIAFYRMFFTTLVWLPFYFLKPKGERPAKSTPRQVRLMLLAGGFLCFHFATWITSLNYTTVASAVFLILAQPILVALAAHFFLRERMNAWNLLAIASMIAGALLIFGGDLRLGRGYLFGDILALLGAVGTSGYLYIARIARPDRAGRGAGVPLHRYLPPVYGTATVGLFLLCVATGQPFGPFTLKTWASLVALALIPTVIGHSLFNWSLRYLPALPVNIALVGEPIGASLLAFALLAESPSRGLLLGSPLMILAVLLVFLKPPSGGEDEGPAVATVPPEMG